MNIPKVRSITSAKETKCMMIPTFLVPPSPELKTKVQASTPNSFMELINSFEVRVTSDSLLSDEFCNVVLPGGEGRYRVSIAGSRHNGSGALEAH